MTAADRAGIARRVQAAALVLAAGVAAVGALAALPLTALLHLRGPGAVGWLTGLLVVHTLVGGYEGIVQGSGRYARLAALTSVFGAARLTGGVLGLLAGRTPGSAMAGMACGAAVGSIVSWLAAGRPVPGQFRQAPVVPALRAAGALLGFVVLSNLDLLLARHSLPGALAGEYAVGAIIVKIVFWLPQGVGVVLLPQLADPVARRAVLPRALALVGGCGAVLCLITAVLGRHALPLVGGAAYGGELGGAAWVFAALGALCAVAQLLLWSGIAADAVLPGVAVWLAVLAESAVVAVLSATGAESVLTIAVTATATVAVLVAGLLFSRAGWRSPVG